MTGQLTKPMKATRIRPESRRRPIARETSAPAGLRDPAIDPHTDDRFADLAVVVSHFNWAGYTAPVRNLLRFLREMDAANVPVYGMEAYLPGTDPVMASARRWTVVEAGPQNVLWQKEPMLNRVVSMVPDHIRYIAAIDPDIHFQNPRWVESTVRALGAHRVIQPFTEAVWANDDGRPDMIRRCSARYGLDQSWNTHPGFAWAFHRDFFDQVGFYPWSVTGAGDTVTATGLLDIPFFTSTTRAIGELNLLNGVAQAWLDKARDYMAGERPGWIDGQVWHEFHGTRRDRQYVHRHVIMDRVDVIDHVRLDDRGLLAWTDEAPTDQRDALAHYFTERREDG